MSKYVYEVYNLKDKNIAETTGSTLTTSMGDYNFVETFTLDESKGIFVSAGSKSIKNVRTGTYIGIRGEIVLVINVKDSSGGSSS
ncbi:hypothetical protein [Lagierella massiliensis]|uniref:hypothetical protein n=1 Tax=Lagierella massiliensis TaxID=1689303 RepID=UPI0006D7D809|nr:hypothetical protein [Lagierella massiliensis]